VAENCIARNFIIRALHEMILGQDDEVLLEEVTRTFRVLVGKMKESDYLENVGVDWRKILRSILKK
jgi:hypothetical protein